jgi:putative oxidoreductase
MKWGFALSPRAVDWGLLFIRIPIGLTFVFHGYQKISMGIPQVAGFLESLQVPAAGFFAYVVTFVEFLGGLCLLVGLITPVWAAMLSILIIVAIAKVHLQNGFDFTKGGFEPHLAWLAILLFLILAGPGRYSVDRIIGGRAPA